jgi:hypothetical protein
MRSRCIGPAESAPNDGKWQMAVFFEIELKHRKKNLIIYN